MAGCEDVGFRGILIEPSTSDALVSIVGFIIERGDCPMAASFIFDIVASACLRSRVSVPVIIGF